MLRPSVSSLGSKGRTHQRKSMRRDHWLVVSSLSSKLHPPNRVDSVLAHARNVTVKSHMDLLVRTSQLTSGAQGVWVVRLNTQGQL
jgi:hypothetical protein